MIREKAPVFCVQRYTETAKANNPLVHESREESRGPRIWGESRDEQETRGPRIWGGGRGGRTGV